MVKAKISDFKPDPKNANKGTNRGREIVTDSLKRLKAGRSVLADKNGVLIAGNKTAEAALAAGLEDAIVIQTDGSQLVVVQRTDLDLATDAAAKELAIADNRSSEISLEWDGEILAELNEEIDLSKLWAEDELEEVLPADMVQESGDTTAERRKLGSKAAQIKPVLYADQVQVFEQALRATGNKNRGEALIQICQAYLDGNSERQLDFS
jgi:hypothetical protein